MKDPSRFHFHGFQDSAKPEYTGYSPLHLLLTITVLRRLNGLTIEMVSLSRKVWNRACVAARTSMVQEY